jgi:hypothetical protein
VAGSSTQFADTSSLSGPLTRRVFTAQSAGQHADEAGPAVGLRGQGQVVVGAATAPAVRDRLGGLDRREAVAVAVGSDQYPHDGRL